MQYSQFVDEAPLSGNRALAAGSSIPGEIFAFILNFAIDFLNRPGYYYLL
jgi:hypothetical protein